MSAKQKILKIPRNVKKLGPQIASNNRSVIFSVYRDLLRACRIAFRGDDRMLGSSRLEVRKNFERNRGFKPDSIEAEQGVEHASATAKILREQVVQGSLVESQGSEISHHYKLDIHPHIRLGDDAAFQKYREQQQEQATAAKKLTDSDRIDTKKFTSQDFAKLKSTGRN